MIKTRKKKNVKERCVLFYLYIYISLYIYINISNYISVYIYMYLYIYKNKQNNVLRLFAFFCKRMKRSHVFLLSLQKNATSSAFFYVLCKRTLCSLRSFMFLRKERKRMLRSFGSHKSPKT